MIIKFLTAEVKAEQEERKLILIAKLWQSREPWNFLEGLVGIKKRDADWNFNEVSLHPGDRIILKPNRYRTREGDPHFLVFVENSPKGCKLYKANQRRFEKLKSMKTTMVTMKKTQKFLPPQSFYPKLGSTGLPKLWR